MRPRASIHDASRHPRMHRSSMWAFVLGACIALVQFMPACWVAAVVESITQQRVQMPQAQGTLWHGSSLWVLRGGDGSTDAIQIPGQLQWHVGLVWRQGPAVSIALHSTCCTRTPLNIQVQLGWSQTTVHVDPHQGQWPASLLVGLGTPWNTLQIQSTLQLETQAIDVQWRAARLTVSGQAQLTAHQASSKLSTLSPMGSYRMQWKALGPTAAQTHDFGQIELLTLQGPLELVGQGQWVAGRFRFNGQASAAAGSEEALSNLLNIVGRRDGTRSIIKIG